MMYYFSSSAGPAERCLTLLGTDCLHASHPQLQQDCMDAKQPPAVQNGSCLKLPSSSPPILHQLFHACTCLVPADRPSAVEIVNVLRRA